MLLSKSIPPYTVADELTNDADGIKFPIAADAERGNWYAAWPNGTAWTGEFKFKSEILIYFELLTQSPFSVTLPSDAIVLFLSPITLAI